MTDRSSKDNDIWSGGAMVGRYRVEKKLGRGGMGVVYLARDTLLHRHVALKRVVVEAATPDLRRRILLEARKASRINDPHIAAVYDVIEAGDELVLVMEYVEGTTLRERIPDHASLDDFWDLADQCLEALESAHREGVVHHDIKPDNVMITPQGGIKILDFGLARLYAVEDATTLSTLPSTHEGLKGTPSYLPPEALRGRAPDVRGDVFSLGVTFYEALAGRRPFDGATRAETYQKILNEAPPSLRETNPEVSPDLETVIARMLAKDPESRYATMTAVREAMLAARRGDAIPLPIHDSDTVLIPTPSRRRPLLYGVLAIVVLGLGGAWMMASRGSAGGPIPPHPNLSVLPPTVKEGSPEFQAIALGATDVLSNDLAQAAQAAGIPFTKLWDVTREDVTTPAGARAHLGSNIVLETILSPRDQALIVEQRLVEGETGQVLRDQRKEVAASVSPLELVDDLTRNARKFLGLPVPNQSRKERFGTEGDGSMRFYLEGLGRYLAAKTPQDLDAAESSLELALKTDPEFARARVEMGWVLYEHYVNDKNPAWLEKARQEAEGALALNSEETGAHKLLGYVLYRLGDPKGAALSLEHTVTADPGDYASFREWGRVYGRQGDLVNEEGIYRRAIAANDYDWRPHLFLANQLFAQGRFDEARESLHAVVQRAPEYYLGYSHLGGIYVLQGQYPEAIKSLDRSLALNPTAEAFSNLGTAYFNLRRFDEAITTYNRSFQFKFENYKLWINLGDALHWSPGREKQAEEAYRQAISLGRKFLEERPYHGEVRAELAPIFARLGQADSARVWISAALAKEANNPNIQYGAALTYWELGQPDEALDRLERAVKAGYPTVWLRDSAVFDAWRGTPRFLAIVGDSSQSANIASPTEGGS